MLGHGTTVYYNNLNSFEANPEKKMRVSINKYVFNQYINTPIHVPGGASE